MMGSNILTIKILVFLNDAKAIPHLTQDCYAETIRSSSIRCLKDILIESQSDTPISIDSCNSSSTEETFPEVNVCVCVYF